VSQGESAVTQPYDSAPDQAQAGQDPQAGQEPEEAAGVDPAGFPAEVTASSDSGAEADAGGAGEADTGEFAEAADQGPGQEETADAAPDPDLADLELEGEIAADYIEGLLDVADLDGDIDMDVEGDRALVSVVGATLDELVGSRGEVLEALQELTRLAVHRQTGARTRIMIDVGGYRLRRRSELAETGRDAADEVKRTGVPKKLWAMNPFERKIVHDAVAAAGLRSESEGEEPDRRVVVLPGS
jgi:spoIIIJ-associated protein